MAGVRECSWCCAYLGACAGIDPHEVTHGICETCKGEVLRELQPAPPANPMGWRIPWRYVLICTAALAVACGVAIALLLGTRS